ncbi:MAG: hypothetical protein IKA74_05955 [Clostridia bacterium]|nr:hypothetical protein [Clostridia bacterium]
MKFFARALRVFPLILFLITVLCLGDGRLAVSSLLLVFAHEVAHWLTLRVLGGGGGFFSVTGGVCLSQSRALSYPAELCILLAGPVANLSLAVVFYFLGEKNLFAQSMLLGVFNLLPVRMLDGGRALETVLSVFLPLTTAVSVAGTVSALTSFSLVISSLYIVFRTGEGAYLVFLSFLCFFGHLFEPARKNLPKMSKREVKREKRSI